MEPVVKIIPKTGIAIVDENYYFALSVKHSLEKEFGDEIAVTVFRSAENFIAETQKTMDMPEIVILNYSQNKDFNEESGGYAVDKIQQLNPGTAIIILSEKKFMEHAVKALAHGAHDFVEKGRFALKHILSSVKKCLHPARV